MEYANKMIVVPIENDIQDKKSNDMEFFLTIISKLAKINAYDKNLNLIINGKSLLNTNIIDYILALKSDSKKYNHMEEFSKLLLDADVDISLIENDQIKSIINKNKGKDFYTKISPIVYKTNKRHKVRNYNDWLTI